LLGQRYITHSDTGLRSQHFVAATSWLFMCGRRNIC